MTDRQKPGLIAIGGGKPAEREPIDTQRLAPDPKAPWVWQENDVERLRAAFHRRFDTEIQPRTETLFAVAMEGIRIFLERERRND